MLEYLLITIAIAMCAIGSYTDLRIREVPDWLNFAGIVTGVGVHLIGAVMLWKGWFLLESVFGLGIGFGIGALMYYSGQWGGGDSKMLMALGALIGFMPKIDNLFFSLLVYTAILGGLYGLVYSFVLAVKNWKKFLAELNKLLTEIRLLRKVLFAIIVAGLFLIVFIDDILFKLLFGYFLIVVPLLLCLYYCIKAVEQCCMLQYVSPSLVTEGDWIAKDIIVAYKRICGPKDLGITKPQLALLQNLGQQGKIKKVLIKYGIPFVPSFLMGLVAALLLKNPLAYIL
ncbi:MAG: prepilin peptidase [Candidatus Aenigmarchaeota archaeon]|nr:prepilin peptidase [Candidatus Aenigmarchaeota archaeon]